MTTIDQIATKDDIAALRAAVIELARKVEAIHQPAKTGWMSVPKAAKAMGRTPCTIMRYVKDGKLEVDNSGPVRLVHVPEPGRG